MFEKFTEGAIKVIMLAQEEARRMGHNFVGTEQLFLGVVGQRQGMGAKALKSFGITLKKARKEVEPVKTKTDVKPETKTDVTTETKIEEQSTTRIK